MQRRELMAWVGGLGVVGVAAAQGTGAPSHDHAAMVAAQKAAPPAARKYAALVAPLQDCVRAAQVCIAHCQQLLAQGDKSLGDCLRTALDCDAVCSATLKLANLNSSFTPALARQSAAVMQACVDACKEHVDHHAECKACHDACLKAIAATRKVA